MQKISSVQLIAVLISIRIFSAMTYFPSANDNSAVMIMGIIAAAFIQAIFIIPALIFYNKHPSENICTYAMKNYRPLGYIICILFVLFFMAATFINIGNFTYFIDYYFTDYISRIVVVIIISLCTIYIASMNISVIGRIAVIILGLFFIYTLIVVSGSFKNADFLNFHLATENKTQLFFRTLAYEIGKSEGAAVLCILMSSFTGKLWRTTYIFLAVKVVIICLIVTAITVILGDYAMFTKLPFFSLSSYSKSQLMERYDAFFMTIWVMMALVKIPTFVYCARTCLGYVVTKPTRNLLTIICTIIPAVTALIWLIPHKWEKFAHYHGGSVIMLIISFIIPSLMLILRRGKKNA